MFCKSRWDSQYKCERKREKDSGRGSINEAIMQMAYCIQKENCLTSEKDDYWRSCVPVIRVTWLRLKYLVKRSTTEETTGKKERKEWLIGRVYQLYGNPVILERIQVERLIPEEIKKKKKGYSFRRIAFFPF